MLTAEQCDDYDLPKTEKGYTELDALVALHPGEMERILESNILRFRDKDVHRRMAEAEQDIRTKLRAIAHEIGDEYDLSGLEARFEKGREAYQPVIEEHEALMGEYEQIKAMFEDLQERYQRRVGSALQEWEGEYWYPLQKDIDTVMEAMAEKMYEQMPDLDDYDLPEANEVELNADCIFDSTRSFVQQLIAYKRYLGLVDLDPDEALEKE